MKRGRMDEGGRMEEGGRMDEAGVIEDQWAKVPHPLVTVTNCIHRWSPILDN